MISTTQLQTTFGKLSQNSSSDNLALGLQLMNIEQRYLLQKYFSNETSFSVTTIGSQSLTTTATLAANAITATLSSAWGYHTTICQVGFSNGDSRAVQFTNGSTSISWVGGLSATATTALAVGGVQFYPTPPNYSKIKTLTITIGALKWTPDEIQTREEWDKLNVFPYYADIPKNYFIFPGGDHGAQVGIWPIPSTTGNTITYNYKFRISDLSLADDTTGTVTVTNGSKTITGSGSSFVPTTNAGLESRWIQIAPNKGDNLWYQVASVNSTTSISLFAPYQGIDVSGGTFTIGQMPILMEDFHDMLIWKALVYYFTSIADNKGKRQTYEGLYDTKLKLLAEYAGTNSVNVNLGRRPPGQNPNLYPQTLS